MKEEMKNGLIVAGVVALILLLTYLCTAFFLTGEIGNTAKEENKVTTKANDDASTSQAVTAEYKNIILASKTFSQKEEKYMVLFYSNKEVSDTIKTLMTNYDAATHDVKLYKVNINEAINNYVIGDTENALAQSVSELKIKGTTLVTIQNGLNVSYTSDNSEIINIIK